MSEPMPEEHVSREPAVKPVSLLRIFLRGLAVSLPAILTVVIVLWVAHGLHNNIISPATWMVKYVVAQFVNETVPSRSLVGIDAAPPLDYCGGGYLVREALRDDYRAYLKAEEERRQQTLADRLAAGQREEGVWSAIEQRRIDWMQMRAERRPTQVYVQLGPDAVPYDVYAVVARSMPPGQVPTSAQALYMEYAANRYFGSVFQLSVLTVLLIVVLLYFLGRFVSARIGSWIVVKFEQEVLGRLPVIRNVYGSVKQVTDFLFSESPHVEYRRVVALQYPRKGIWTIGFVTGESMLDIAVSAGEPCVAVLIPTSPMPMTGFTISVPRSEVLDLNLTVEQAMQFCISCGVLTPPQQRLSREMLQRLVKTGVMRNPMPGESVRRKGVTGDDPAGEGTGISAAQVGESS